MAHSAQCIKPAASLTTIVPTETIARGVLSDEAVIVDVDAIGGRHALLVSVSDVALVTLLTVRNAAVPANDAFSSIEVWIAAGATRIVPPERTNRVRVCPMDGQTIRYAVSIEDIGVLEHLEE